MLNGSYHLSTNEYCKYTLYKSKKKISCAIKNNPLPYPSCKTRVGSGFIVVKRIFTKALLGHQHAHDIARRLGDGATRTEDGGYTGTVQEVVVLRGDHSPGNHHDITAAQAFQLFDHLRYQRFMAGREG